MRRALFPALALFVAGACHFDPAYRDLPDFEKPPCVEGAVACVGSLLSRCENAKEVTIDDCGAKNLQCAGTLQKCTPCLPLVFGCDANNNVTECDAAGQVTSISQACDASKGIACRSGACVDLCQQAADHRSNIGCEYWPVDLDNAVLSTGNAAIQQYAVIVSNPQPDLAATVTVEEDDADVGQPANIRTVLSATVGVNHLEVLKLGPREVDGSPPDVPNGGTGTALTRHAFRLRSNVPVVAYQFNPLENVNVFSNDATVLLPTSALSGAGVDYLAATWAQTITHTDDPNTNWPTDPPTQLRTFLAIVGTTADTNVTITTRARVIPGGPFAAGIAQGQTVTTTVQPFEVLNLETGDFHADFTGSFVTADQPIVVYVGSEASDAPIWSSLSVRECCADHLESQLMPRRNLGKHFAVGRMPNRSQAVAAAGASGLGLYPEVELYRVVAAESGPTHVTTTLDAPWDKFDLSDQGADVIIPALRDFTMTSSQPILLADVQVGQEGAGISISVPAPGLPGGDPSLMLVPPTEQWRSDYTLLTPDKYVFDFLVVTAPPNATVFIDGLKVDSTVCEVANGEYSVYRCQLSFPVVDETTNPITILPGRQNDGVHRVQSDVPIGVVVYGFDYRVSYAYSGGYELDIINPN